MRKRCHPAVKAVRAHGWEVLVGRVAWMALLAAALGEAM